MCDAFRYSLDNVFIRVGSKLYKHIVDIPMGRIVVLLLQSCCLVMRGISWCLFMTIIKLVLLKLLTLDGLLNIDTCNPYFEQMLDQTYHTELLCVTAK